MPQVDLAKRRRIMQRSMKLGHCICDPRRPCPCSVFTGQGICPCSGERPDPVDLGRVKLTELVHNAGCASKIAPGDLEAVLSRLPAVDDPAVLSGVPAGDDAGIYRLSDGTQLVQTVDVMTPCVDDAETFGRICAANCLSDIYAMGGVPRTALSILAFPSETLDGRLMYAMLKGAMDVLKEAGVALIGGHSIKDEEIKLGFAITGTLEGAAVEHGTARAGDVLVLTKPLGTGVLGFARQIGRSDGGGEAVAAASMMMLNKAAAEAMREVGVSAGTDITGFGLFGHLISMARHSGVTAQVYADALPALPGAVEALRDGVIPGAIERNREYVGPDLTVADGVDEALVNLGLDAQTSGGLLIAVPEQRLGRLREALVTRGQDAVIIGRITGQSSGRIVVTNAGADPPAIAERPVEVDLPHPPLGGRPAAAGRPAEPCCAEAAPSPSSPAAPAAAPGDQPCCAEAGQAPSPPPAATPAAAPTDQPCCAEAAAGASASQPASRAAGQDGVAAHSVQAFGTLMRITAAAGQLDERTKELITMALAVQSRCGPCFEIHLKRARKMGITQEELDEVAWLAVAMGGAPVRLFYEAALKSAGRSCC